MNALFSILRADRAVGQLVETLTAAPQQTLAYGFAGSMKHAAAAGGSDSTAARGGYL